MIIDTQEIKKRAEIQKVSPSVILKDYLHQIILVYIFKKGLFSGLVFQGGTALRLIYKGVRYSEGLDFVLKKKNISFFKNLNENLKSLPSYIDRFIPFAKNIRLKSQKDTPSFKRFNLTLETDFLGAKDRTQIEIACIPSYSNKISILQTDILPLNPAVVAKTPHEILADKLLAFSLRDYLKGRDIWDIYFILTTLSIPLDEKVKKMLRKKISDYKIGIRKFKFKFHKNLSLLKKNGVLILKTEMDRFLPAEYRNLFKSKYSKICKDEAETLEKLLKSF